MKIEDNNGLEALKGASQVSRVGPAFQLFQAYGAQAPAGPDAAALSAEAQEIQHYAQKLKALPEIREDKVAALQQQLQNQSYSVKVADLAEAMFRLAELDQ